jgi:long-chain fatty acid transport protein
MAANSIYQSLRTACACLLATTAATVAWGNTLPAHAGLTAYAENAVTSIMNPAGLTRLESPDWVFQGLVFVSESEFVQSAPGAPIVTEDDGFLIAPFVYYGRPINDKWAFGISATAIAQGEDVGDTGLSKYLVTEWALVTASLSPAFAYRLNDKFSVGAAVNINYTYFFYESAVFNPEPGIGDGIMEIEDSDITLSGQLSLLWELSPQTRVGVNYRSENKPEFSDTPKFEGLGPTRQMMLDMSGATATEIAFKSTTPQLLATGIFHEFNNDLRATFDAIWFEFSDFGMTEFRVGDSSVDRKEQEFEDIWAFSAGLEYPLNDRWTIKGGVMGTTQFIKDVNRTKSFTLDQIFAIGAGFDYKWGDNKIVGLNLNYYDMGDAPVQVDIPMLGTMSGQYSENYAIGVDFTFRWIR